MVTMKIGWFIAAAVGIVVVTSILTYAITAANIAVNKSK